MKLAILTTAALLACGGSATTPPANPPGETPPPLAELPADEAQEAEQAPPQVDFGDGTPRQVGQYHYAVSLVCIEAWLLHPIEPGRDRFVAAIENGEAIGYELDEVHPRSLLAGLGFQDGDTVLAVNGAKLNTMEEVGKLYMALDDTRRMNVSVTRDNRPITIVIDVDHSDSEATCPLWSDV